MLERLKELICDMAKFLTRLGAGLIQSYRSATKEVTLCAMRGVSAFAQTTQNASLGQRLEAVAVSKEHGLLSVRINRC